MSRILVESLRGVDAIHAGDVLLRTTSYDLSRWWEPDSDGSGQAPRTTRSGHIDITGIAETAVLAGPGNFTADPRGRAASRLRSHEQRRRHHGRGWLPE
jgi:hypothetical protein